jgi:N-carbamoylputrescine amidase
MKRNITVAALQLPLGMQTRREYRRRLRAGRKGRGRWRADDPAARTVFRPLFLQAQDEALFALARPTLEHPSVHRHA